MLRQRKAAVRVSATSTSRGYRSGKLTTASMDGHTIEELLAQESFRTLLFNMGAETVMGRLDTQSNDLSQSQLVGYLQNVLHVDDQHRNACLQRIKNSSDSNVECLVKVTVQRAEDLAAKDVDGTSDPYCSVSLMRGSNSTEENENRQTTSIRESTLNPEWNETFELRCKRTEVGSSAVQLQVWDCDLGQSKKVKGLRGIKRYVKETVSSNDDDFMGQATIPLCSVPSEGLEKFSNLKAKGSHKTLKGRVRVKVEVSPIGNQAKEFTPGAGPDSLYAGLLSAAIEHAREGATTKMDYVADSGWNGSLPQTAQIILREFASQHQISQLTLAIVSWECYINCHTSKQQLNTKFIQGLVGNLDECMDEFETLQRGNQTQANMRYTADLPQYSAQNLFTHSCQQLAQLREIFSSTKQNFVVNMGNLLICLDKMRKSDFLLSVAPPVFFSRDFSREIKKSLQSGTENHYLTVYDQMEVEYLELQERNDDDERTPESDHIQRMAKICDGVLADLQTSRNFYHMLISKYLDIDYYDITYHVLADKLASDASDTMTKWGNAQIGPPDMQSEPSKQTEKYNTTLFALYVKLREMANLDPVRLKKQRLAPYQKHGTLAVEVDSVDSSPPDSVDDPNEAGEVGAELVDFHNWFRPAVLRWLQMSRVRTSILLKKAVEVDEMKRLDEIVKHTSSAVDAIACLSGVLTFWSSLQWPDPVDAYTISLRLTDDIAGAIETYADLLHRKLIDVGYFDDDGQFDVTESLCLALNDLQYVRAYTDDLPKKMDIETLANLVDRHPLGPSREKVISTVNALINSALFGMNKKIRTVTDVVGLKMKAVILKFLRQFACDLTKHPNPKRVPKAESDRAILRSKAATAVKPLMEYLMENVMMLHEWLCEPNFVRLLEVIWETTLKVFQTVALKEFVESKPNLFYQCRYLLNTHLLDFFYADGIGIPQSRLKSFDDFQLLESEMKMRCAKTVDLLRLYYVQMYEEQMWLANSPIYGRINIYTWYDPPNKKLHVDVISAENLIPLDVGGTSDPFVTLSLAPKAIFRKQPLQQTLVEKKTLDPLFHDESFTFTIDRKFMALEGTALVLNVYDHDLIGVNDFEGQAVLLLNMIDGVSEQPRTDKEHGMGENGVKEFANNKQKTKFRGPDERMRTFRLPLTRPGHKERLDKQKNSENNGGASRGYKLSSDDDDDAGHVTYERPFVVHPQTLLDERSNYDKDADEFSRTRKKLEKQFEADKVVLKPS